MRVVDGSTGAAIDARTVAVNLQTPGIWTTPFPRRAPESVAVPEGAVTFVAALMRVRVNATLRGCISTSPELVLTRAGERQDVTITLSPANCGIRGRALNHDGSPIAAAAVSVYRASDEGFEGVPVVPPETRDDGSFHVRGLAAGEYTLVVSDGVVSDGGDAPAIARATAAETPPTVELRSPEGVRTRFRVVAPPAPGGRSDEQMSFRIVNAASLPLYNHFGAFLQTGWAGSTFGATLVPGRYRVFVWFHGCKEGSVEFDVPAGGTIEIPLERAR